VEAIHDGDLRGLTFREGDVTWFVVHNLCARKRVWKAQVAAGSQCAVFRGLDAGEGRPLKAGGGRLSVPIAPLQHVVVKVVAQ